MSDLVVVTYCWGNQYPNEYVERVVRGFKRHLEEPHRFVVVTDQPGRFGVGWRGFEVARIPREDMQFTKIKGCFARLRLFDPKFQDEIGAYQRIVCVDLDVVVTGPLFPLFMRTEQFMILKGANASNPNPANGSLWLLRAGYRPDIWSSFSIEAAQRMVFDSFPDDQGWFWHKFGSDVPGWNVGEQSGIWSFAKRGWPKDNKLPQGARMVVFPGWRDPSKFQGLDWVRDNWV